MPFAGQTEDIQLGWNVAVRPPLTPDAPWIDGQGKRATLFEQPASGTAQ